MLWKKALSLLVFLCVGGVGTVTAQTGTISGTVAAASGETLPGANVQVVGLQRGASTDAKGAFRVSGMEPGSYDVRASFIGYQSQTKEVEVVAGETVEVNFVLRASGIAMDEMVVVGYGTQERSELTGSIWSVHTKDVED